MQKNSVTSTEYPYSFKLTEDLNKMWEYSAKDEQRNKSDYLRWLIWQDYKRRVNETDES